MQLANHGALMPGGPRAGPCLRNRNLSPGLPGALFGPDRPCLAQWICPISSRARVPLGSLQNTQSHRSICCSKHSGDSTVCLTLQQNLEFARSGESIN